MGMIDFFSSIANNFKNHYQALTDSVTSRPSRTYTLSKPEESAPPQIPVESDSYAPTPEALKLAGQAKTETADEQPVNDETETPTPPTGTTDETAPPTDTTEQPVTDYTTMLKRRSHLEYKMDLRFDLSAITRTVEQLADGDTTALEEFAAAGFGLSADMDFKGHQLINAHGEFDETAASHQRGMSLNRASNARQFAYQDRNFGVQSFYNEATRIQRNMNFESRGNHRLAVNKFALRYRMDSALSFGMLNRFNVQTEQMAQSKPENLNDYLATAGNVAEKSTAEMMGVFFDAVDEYLAASEEQLISKASEFFEMAARELGFSGEIVETAKDQFIGTIENFFDKVNQSVDSLASQFVPDNGEIPTDGGSIVPSPEYYVPNVTQDKSDIAIA